MSETPVTLVTPIRADRLNDLRQLLEPPGGGYAYRHSGIAWERLAQVHFASMVIVDAHGDGSAYLVLEASVDGTSGDFLHDLVELDRGTIDRIYRHCVGYPEEPPNDNRDVCGYLSAHDAGAGTFYVGNPGRPVGQAIGERALRRNLMERLDSIVSVPARAYLDGPPVAARLARHVQDTPAMLWALRPSPTPFLVSYGRLVVIAAALLVAAAALSTALWICGGAASTHPFCPAWLGSHGIANVVTKFGAGVGGWLAVAFARLVVAAVVIALYIALDFPLPGLPGCALPALPERGTQRSRYDTVCLMLLRFAIVAAIGLAAAWVVSTLADRLVHALAWGPIEWLGQLSWHTLANSLVQPLEWLASVTFFLIVAALLLVVLLLALGLVLAGSVEILDRWHRATHRGLRDDRTDATRPEPILQQEIGFDTVQNHFASVTLIKEPRWVRRALLRFVLTAIDLAARTIFNRGLLGGTPNIHFARWLIIDGGKRLLFLSNYDGGWDGYLSDFIQHSHVGLNAIWDNTRLADRIYPRASFWFGKGALDELRFKAYAGESQIRTLVWYRGYENATVTEIDANTALRNSLTDLDALAESMTAGH